MRRPLIERLPMDAPELARFDETIDTVDLRGAVRARYEPETNRAYRRCWRRYVEWCELKRREARELLEGSGLEVPGRVHEGYQPDPAKLTTELITEFARYLCKVKRYAVSTCLQAVRALEVYATRAGVTVSVKPAQEVVAEWAATVRELEARAEAERQASKRAERVPW